MVSLLHLERRSWLLILLLTLAQDSKAAAAILGARQSGKGRGGDDQDGDSDSDSDNDSQSCSNGVCVSCRRGNCTTSTQGSNQASQTRSAAAATSNTGASSNTHSTPTASGAADSASTNSSKAGHKGLNTGGIVGLVIGLLILSGLLIMFLFKRRSQRRHAKQKPRVAMLLPKDTPSDVPSLNSSSRGAGSEMVESMHSPGIVGSAAGAITAANLAAMPRSGYPAPEPYKPFNTEIDGTAGPSTSAPNFVAQSKANGMGHQGGASNERHTRTSSTSPLLPPEPLVSPHEQFLTSPFDATNSTAIASVALSSDDNTRQSQALSSVSSSTHAEMIAFQKELERDREKDGQLVGGRNVDLTDPPPTYSDR